MKVYLLIEILGGGFKDFWNFHPEPWGNDPIVRAYFSNGLKPPTRIKIPYFKRCIVIILVVQICILSWRGGRRKPAAKQFSSPLARKGNLLKVTNPEIKAKLSKISSLWSLFLVGDSFFGCFLPLWNSTCHIP